MYGRHLYGENWEQNNKSYFLDWLLWPSSEPPEQKCQFEI